MALKDEPLPSRRHSFSDGSSSTGISSVIKRRWAEAPAKVN